MFKLNLATPEKKIVAGQELQDITLPAFKGELNILLGHAPLMTTLNPGILSYRLKDGTSAKMAISWGYCQVSPEGVNVLAESAVSADQIDISVVKDHLKNYETRLSSDSMSEHEWQTIQNEVSRLRAEIELFNSMPKA
jgi:F-type H+-transporting ATPase subunit epsilon